MNSRGGNGFVGARVSRAAVAACAGALVLAVAPAAALAAGPRLQLAWPTPSHAWLDGAPITAWVQPTESGEPTSGLFGCVRSGGTQFHEGLDIRPTLPRDRAGEPTDDVFAFGDGVVRHINRQPGNSSYGRYIVIEHTGFTPAVATLYAHLREIAPGLAPGQAVERGAVIGGMGRSAGGYVIPKDRAHLHFEIAVRLSDDFESWYRWRKFGSPNEHAAWNGMNLAGLDPLEFLERFRERRVDNFAEYFAGLEPAVRVRVRQAGRPDFVRRYPALVSGDEPAEGIAGWEVGFTGFGLPCRWRPLAAGEVAGLKDGGVEIVSADAEMLKQCRCKQLVVSRGKRSEPGRDLQTALQLLFGLRR